MRAAHLLTALIATGVVVAASCGDPELVKPPPEKRICKAAAPAPAAPWFTDVTAEVGLSPTDTFKPMATGLAAGDLDGDGYPDLIAAFFPSGREDLGTIHTRFVFMNRPDPNDPTKRVFVDETESSGVFSARSGAGLRGAASMSIGDVDNDGDQDVIGCPAWGPTTPPQGPDDTCDVAINDGKGHFALGASSGLDQDKLFWSSAGVLFDFDRDGVLDYWPATFGYDELGAGIPKSKIRLYRGAGDGTFTNVASTAGLPASATSGAVHRANFGISVCDLDGDGDDDLITANYARTHNEVFRNDGGVFTEIGADLGVASDANVDFSDDESYRCYCKTNACTPAPPAPKVSCTAFGNPYFRGWVPGITDSPSYLGGNTFSITCGDVDDDGDMDLMTAEVRHGDVGNASDRSELLVNAAGPGAPPVFSRPGNVATGLDRGELDLAGNEGDNIALFVDVDLDGRKDVYLASSNYPTNHAWLFHQGEDGKFTDMTGASGIGRESGEGPVFLDYDRDGDLDLAIGAGLFNNATKDPIIRVYRNDVASARNLVRVRLVGSGAGGANRDAFGASVKLTAGGRTQTREVRSSWGHSGLESESVLTFGLGDTCDVDAIEIRWPDAAGSTTTITNPRANVELVITQGNDAPEVVELANDQ